MQHRGSSADEVHNLQAVTVDYRCLGPGRAGDDGAVEFDGYAVGLEAERLDDAGEVGWRDEVGEGAGLAIELDGEGCWHTVQG